MSVNAWPFEKLGAGQFGESSDDGTVRRSGRPPGPAALRVSASGHGHLSVRAMDALGWPTRVLIAAREGALIIKTAEPDDHRAYSLVWHTDPVSGQRGNSRFAAGSAFLAAGMRPKVGSARYVAIECDSEDGRLAIYVRRDQAIPVENRRQRLHTAEAVTA